MTLVVVVMLHKSSWNYPTLWTRQTTVCEY